MAGHILIIIFLLPINRISISEIDGTYIFRTNEVSYEML